MGEFAVEVDMIKGTSIVVLRCHGDVDAHSCGRLDGTITGVLGHKVGGEDVKHVIIDFSGVGFTASKGLGVLINARKLLDDRDGGLVLLRPNESVMSTLEVLGFDTMFDIASTEEEARAILEGDEG